MGGFDGEMFIAGHDGSDNDNMAVRLGGSNNFVEKDNESIEGAPGEDREAMLRRLDDVLAVLPELDIRSSEDGQFHVQNMIVRTIMFFSTIGR